MPDQQHARGQSLAEFALVLPIIFLVVLALLDIGRAVFVNNTLSEASRQASRLAIVDQNETRVKDQAVAYAPAVGLTTAEVDVCFKTPSSTLRTCTTTADTCGTSTARQLGCLAIVTSTTTVAPMTPVLSLFVPSLTLSSTSVGSIEYVCPTATKSTCP